MILIDASFFLAYDNINDVHHESALRSWTEIESGKFGSYFTSDYIFNEVVGVTLRKLGKKWALIIGNQILKAIIILNIDDHILAESWKLFSQTKFNLNLVDCSSIIAMRISNTKYIATFDKEFKHIKDIKVIDV